MKIAGVKMPYILKEQKSNPILLEANNIITDDVDIEEICNPQKARLKKVKYVKKQK